jgi:putative addiction module component (TIGR02574 family)
MTLADFPELKRLSRPARLKIAQELWDSAASDKLPIPASHKPLVRSRRAAYNRGEMATVTLTELKRTIRRRP